MENKLFTKYLSVVGRKSPRCILKNKNSGHIATLVCSKDPYMYDDNWEVVKLFVCSRNIKVGDKVKAPVILNGQNAWSTSAYLNYKGNFQQVVGIDKEFIVTGNTHINGGGFTTEDSVVICKYNSYKIIGEVSPDALSYVKEGQEFSEDEVNAGFGVVGLNVFLNISEDNPFIKEYESHINAGDYYKLCKIKGPCGHFH